MHHSLTEFLNPIPSLSIDLNLGTLDDVKSVIEAENGVIKKETKNCITASITHGLRKVTHKSGSTGKYRIEAKTYDDSIKIKIIFLDYQLFIFVFSFFCLVIFITSTNDMYEALVAALLAPYVGKLILPISSVRYWKNRFGNIS